MGGSGRADLSHSQARRLMQPAWSPGARRPKAEDCFNDAARCWICRRNEMPCGRPLKKVETCANKR